MTKEDKSLLERYLASCPIGTEFQFAMHPRGWNLEVIEAKDGKRRIALKHPFPLIDDGYISRVAEDRRESE